MEEIKYIDGGDATYPQGEGKKFVIHCCNDIGGWGRGFVLALNKRWGAPKAEFKKWSKQSNYQLGNIQAVKVEKDIAVINMVGQRDIKTLDGIPPIRYKAIEKCLVKVADLAVKYSASIHAPKFGSDLAGGDWDKIEAMIKDLICSRDIPVTIYNWDK